MAEMGNIRSRQAHSNAGEDVESPRENFLSSSGSCENSFDGHRASQNSILGKFKRRKSKRKTKLDSEAAMSDAGSLESSFNGYGEPNEGIDSLLTKTKFTRTELQRMYRGFKNDCPNGYADKETFKKIYAHFFPSGTETGEYAGLVFNAFDVCRRGKLSYENFITRLSTALHGTQEEKLKWMFNLYDVDGDGMISKEDLNVVVSAVHSLLGCISDDDIAINRQVLRIFEILDKTDDGYVTQDVFIDNCANDECISQSLSMFDTQR